MKYIILVIGLLVVGCGNGVEVDPYGPMPYDPHKGRDDTTEKPVKELTAEEKKVVGTYEMNEADGTTEKPVKESTKEDVVGSYEARGGGGTYKQVFLDNGVYEWHVIGKKEWGAKWKIVNRELHIDIGDGYISVWKINEDNSITKIAYIEDGKRTGLPKEPPLTYIKIK